MIVVGDIQIQKNSAHLFGTRNLFKWLLENFKDEVVVQVGDWWETTCTHNDIEAEFDGYASQFKELHIIEGNHDKNGRNGSALKRLANYPNIHIYKDPTEVIIDGFKCLMLPYDKDAKIKYESLSFKGDYSFIHYEPIESSFGDSGLILENIDAVQIYGHIHNKKIISDKRIVIGVVVPNKANETNNPIMKIDKTGISYIDHPIWFEYQDIEYGQFPENKNNILNIKNAPSFQSIWNMYKGYHVRKEGVTLIRTENEASKEEVAFELGNPVDKFKLYSIDKKLPKEIHDCGIEYLKEVV